jgi:hypothetical protein
MTRILVLVMVLLTSTGDPNASSSVSDLKLYACNIQGLTVGIFRLAKATACVGANSRSFHCGQAHCVDGVSLTEENRMEKRTVLRAGIVPRCEQVMGGFEQRGIW